MALNLLIENPQFEGRRIVIDPVTLRDHEVRGWVAVGLCSDPAREPLLTDDEWAEAEAAEAARVAALLTPKADSGTVATGTAFDATIITSTYDHDDDSKE